MHNEKIKSDEPVEPVENLERVEPAEPAEPAKPAESVEDKRIKIGEMEYIMKCTRYGKNGSIEFEEFNTPGFIGALQEFFQVRNIMLKIKKVKNENEEILGFGHGKKPLCIMGGTQVGGETIFLMKWEEDEKLSFVLAKEAKLICPQLIIDYYSKHVMCPIFVMVPVPNEDISIE